MRHIFDAPDNIAPIEKNEEPYIASKLLDDENLA